MLHRSLPYVIIMMLVWSLFGMPPATVPEASAQGLEAYQRTLRKLAEKGRSATVTVSRNVPPADAEQNGRDEDGKRKTGPEAMSFSGTLIRADGYIVTVARPVRNTDDLVVTIDERRRTAKVVGKDPISDLAVLKVEGTSYSFLKPAASPDLRPGSVVVTVGNAYGLERSISSGVISGLNRAVRLKGDMEMGLIQLTAPVNPGDQGGPVLGADGSMIGMVMGTFRRNPRRRKWKRKALKRMLKAYRKRIRNRDGGDPDGPDPGVLAARIRRHWMPPEGIHFAVPSDTVKWVTDQLIRSGSVERGWIGVYIRTGDRRIAGKDEEANAAGFRIIGVNPGGPGHRAGLRTGDVILGVDGERIGKIGTLRKRVFRSEPGSKLEVSLVRDGKRLRRMVTVGAYREKPGERDR